MRFIKEPSMVKKQTSFMPGQGAGQNSTPMRIGKQLNHTTLTTSIPRPGSTVIKANQPKASVQNGFSLHERYAAVNGLTGPSSPRDPDLLKFYKREDNKNGLQHVTLDVGHIQPNIINGGE